MGSVAQAALCDRTGLSDDGRPSRIGGVSTPWGGCMQVPQSEPELKDGRFLGQQYKVPRNEWRATQANLLSPFGADPKPWGTVRAFICRLRGLRCQQCGVRPRHETADRFDPGRRAP